MLEVTSGKNATIGKEKGSERRRKKTSYGLTWLARGCKRAGERSGAMSRWQEDREGGTRLKLGLYPQGNREPLKVVFFLIFYLFIHERHRERGRDIGRGRSRLPKGSLVQDSIPGSQDHHLSQRQRVNH